MIKSRENNPDQTPPPSNTRVFLGLAAGVSAALAIYGAEGYVSYALLEVVKAAFQSPDNFTSGAGVLSVLGIMYMLLNNSGEFPRAVLASGIRADQAVNEAILCS